MYLKPITGESHTPLHFRGKFLPVSLVRKVPFRTNTVLCIFETLPDRKILYTHLNSAQKVMLSSPIEVRGPKKKLDFVVQCYGLHNFTDRIYIYILFNQNSRKQYVT